jgi:hypothetical protein
MGTAHLAVHGFLLREAVFSQRGFARKNKTHNQSRCGRTYTGEKWEKRRRKKTWSTFGAMPLVYVLTGGSG